MLGVDVVVAAAPEILPADDRAACPVANDRREVLVTGGSTQGPAIGGPRRVHGPGGQQVLGVDVVLDAPAVVVPGNDRAACSVRDDRGGVL